MMSRNHLVDDEEVAGVAALLGGVDSGTRDGVAGGVAVDCMND